MFHQYRLIEMAGQKIARATKKKRRSKLVFLARQVDFSRCFVMTHSFEMIRHMIRRSLCNQLISVDIILALNIPQSIWEFFRTCIVEDILVTFPRMR